MTEKNFKRPSWDEYFMAIARIIATRANCDRLRTGAVLVKDKRIISTGYNGAPPGLPTCDEVGHLMEEGHCVRTIHSEHNVIIQVARLQGSSTEGSTLYTLYSPCIHCSKYIIAAGVKRVVFSQVYRNNNAVEYLKSAGLDVDVFQESKEVLEQMQELFKNGVLEVKAEEGDIKLQGKE